MPAPCTYKRYPLGNGFVLEVTEGPDEMLCLTEVWEPAGRSGPALLKPRKRFEVRLHGSRAEITLKGGSAFIPVPLYVGLIVAREWRIEPRSYPSYLKAVASHAAGDIDAQAVSA